MDLETLQKLQIDFMKAVNFYRGSELTCKTLLEIRGAIEFVFLKYNLQDIEFDLKIEINTLCVFGIRPIDNLAIHAISQPIR